MVIGRRILYSGRVQGVGFRFTAVSVAERYNVSGYVMNLPDGRVEVYVEGEPEEIESFLRDLESQMRGYIKGKDVEDLPSTGRYKRFTVRYY